MTDHPRPARLSSPLDCRHGNWYRDTRDFTWCMDCGRWRDDVMTAEPDELDVESPRPVTRYMNHGGSMAPDIQGQWVHVADLRARGWKLDPPVRFRESDA